MCRWKNVCFWFRQYSGGEKGEEALQELGRVLEKNKDINILVEGHTDNVPINGTLPSGAKDNWGSVLRGHFCRKIILKNVSIDPQTFSFRERDLISQ